MSNCGPDFLGIGAARSGTTWLYAQLHRTPGIWLPPVKELHYFDRSPQYNSPNMLNTESLVSRLANVSGWKLDTVLRFIRDFAKSKPEEFAWWRRWYFGRYTDEWYLSLFDEGNNYCSGEITPAYAIIGDDDVRKLKRLLPELKLLYMVRDPVERDWSALRKNVHRDKLPIDLEDADQAIAELSKFGNWERGDYAGTLERYLAHFPKEQLLIGFFEAIKQQPDVLLDDILSFLEVENPNKNNILTGSVNASPESEMPELVREFLNDRYQKTIDQCQALLGGYTEYWGQQTGCNEMRVSTFQIV